MTSPALVVLALALVCSIFGTASEQTADPASEHAMHTQPGVANDVATHNKMNTRTNINSYRPLNSLHYYGNKELEQLDFQMISNKHFQFGEQKRNDDLAYNENKEFKSKTIDDIYNEDIDRAIEQHVANVELRNQRFFDNDIKVSKSRTESETKYINLGEDRVRNFDTSVVKQSKNLDEHASHSHLVSKYLKRVKREDDVERCDAFNLNTKVWKIQHPHNVTNTNDKNYYSNVNCVTVLAAEEGQVIKLTFVDVFHIEDHPKCQYDFLEIRDGRAGYGKLRGRFCGEVFPAQVISSGRYLWLKFSSDETIEYEGFSIKVEMYNAPSHTTPESCYKNLTGMTGSISSAEVDTDCVERTGSHALDVLWTITSPAKTNIYLNFTQFSLARPNECEENVVQVFGYILEDHAKLAHYCGSMANPVTTKAATEGKSTVEQGNVMYVHMQVSQQALKKTQFNATFTAFRTLDPSKEVKCREDEFNCEDNTCIEIGHTCDGYGHCRLKADEDGELCKGETESMIKQPHIMVILVIFSLILSGMSFVFLFKCIRKLYQDHKIIKEHIRQSCEDRLDTMIDSRLMLDAKRLQRDSEPRASLEQENHANELFKQQRSMSQHKQTSIESDFQDTHLDLEDEPWRREVETIPETQDLKAERNGRTRRSDTSKKEEAMRNRKESEERKEIRDAAVGAPDTKESSCQTRESLFQADTAPSSDGSNSNSRGFSTFGYSGATLARPSPPAPASPPPPPALSSVHIELLRQIPHESSKSQKKMSERRPMSSETTRSAPDVIIVSKPIR